MAFLKNKKGISGVVVVLLLVLLTISLVSILWIFLEDFARGQLDRASSCFEAKDKVKLEEFGGLTCFDSSSEELRFFLSVGDVQLDGVRVAISNRYMSRSFVLTNTYQDIENLKDYSEEDLVKLPEKNSGLSYSYSWEEPEPPRTIQVAAIIGRESCDVSDSIARIENCVVFT